MLIVLVLTLVAHEALHAAGYAIAGAKARFGIGMLGILPVLYTTVKDNKKLTISQVLLLAICLCGIVGVINYDWNNFPSLWTGYIIRIYRQRAGSG